MTKETFHRIPSLFYITCCVHVSLYHLHQVMERATSCPPVVLRQSSSVGLVNVVALALAAGSRQAQGPPHLQKGDEFLRQVVGGKCGEAGIVEGFLPASPAAK
jgi:hypothetical protein